MSEKKTKTKPEIIFMSAKEYHERRKNLKRFQTGTQLDELLGGGIQETEVVEWYGDYGSGKTQICFTSCVLIAQQLIENKDKRKIVYVDTEDTFKPERIIEICDARGLKWEQILKRIIHVPCLKTDQLEYLFTEMRRRRFKVVMLVIDSLTALYREEYVGRGKLSDRQGALRLFLVDLKNYVRQQECYCMVTNQVQDDLSVTYGPLWMKQKAVGGHTLYHIIDNRLFLRRGKEGTRIARLMDSSRYPEGERPYRITDFGIEDPTEYDKRMHPEKYKEDSNEP